MKSQPLLLPKTLRILEGLGENIRMARLRRRMSAEQLAMRAGMSRRTLYQIEKGSPTVAMGNYLQALFILGLEKDMAQVAAADPLGRKLQDLGIATRMRAPKTKKDPENDTTASPMTKPGPSPNR
jgi:transcriptional regulator with XRE-family HTH domain